jgi:hypothetical protein
VYYDVEHFVLIVTFLIGFLLFYYFIVAGWRKLHTEELNNLYFSPSILRMIMSRRMRWAGHVARMREKQNSYRILVGNPEGKRPLGRPRCKLVDNIKMDLR